MRKSRVSIIGSDGLAYSSVIVVGRSLLTVAVIVASLHGASMAMADTPASGWLLDLRLFTHATHDSVEIGTDINASDGFDEGIDRPEPPPPPGDSWLQAYATGRGPVAALNRLDKSISDPQTRSSWNLTFAAGATVAEAWLSWKGVEAPGYAVELVVGSQVVDLRAAGTKTIRFAAGVASVKVDAYLLDGTVPSPPRLLLATPTSGKGDVSLTWLPPEDDGGLPLRGYRVYRLGLAQRIHIATLDLTTSYVDEHREVGEVPRYEVEAYNALGTSGPSKPAFGVGTGRERTLTPTSDAAERNELAGAKVDTRPTVEALPSMELDGSPTSEDPRVYRVRVNIAGEKHGASLFIAGLFSEPLSIHSNDASATLRADGAASISWGTSEIVVGLALSGENEEIAAPVSPAAARALRDSSTR